MAKGRGRAMTGPATGGDRMRMFLPLSGILAVLLLPFLLAGAGGWDGQRSFSEELGSTLGISALGVLAILVILPSRLRALARLGADMAVRLHRHPVGGVIALLVGHVGPAGAPPASRAGVLRVFCPPRRARGGGAAGGWLWG